MRYFALGILLASSAANAVDLTPFVHGGLDNVAPGSWTVTTKRRELLVHRDFGSTFYIGGGFAVDVAKFRQKRIVPTLSLETEGGFTRYSGKWSHEDIGLWEQTFNQITVTETLILRIKVPAGSRLITPYVGAGGGIAVAPSSINRLDGNQQGENNEGSATAFSGAYDVVFGLEVTLSPRHTIYGRFGPVVPVGSVVYDYDTGRPGLNARERTEASVPNSFMILFGYRWGQ